jgi:NAD(P)-dependent dehydrogenase (short-subunit alcohol dehydrogenase family)
MSRRVSDLHRTAFVTGASSGLGRAFAEMLLGDGVRVWGTSRDPARLRSAGPLPQLNPVPLDLGDPAAAEAAYRRAASEAGGFGLVVNNAGFGVFGEFDALGFDLWRGQVDALLLGTARLAHAAYGDLRARGRGCLVNVSSLAVDFPLPFMSGYNVAKAGLSALSASLAQEAAGGAVTVIDFRPGDYRTGFNDAMRPGAGMADGARTAPALARLDALMAAAPGPERAAADLRRAVLRDRSGVVRSGGFFQARAAPLLARLAPAGLVSRALARYFGLEP